MIVTLMDIGTILDVAHAKLRSFTENFVEKKVARKAILATDKDALLALFVEVLLYFRVGKEFALENIATVLPSDTFLEDLAALGSNL